jgi:hypothetical protein
MAPPLSNPHMAPMMAPYEGMKRKLDLVESNGKSNVVLSNHTGYVSWLKIINQIGLPNVLESSEACFGISVSLSTKLIRDIRGDEKNAYMWNLQGESLQNCQLLNALPHCRDTLSS